MTSMGRDRESDYLSAYNPFHFSFTVPLNSNSKLPTQDIEILVLHNPKENIVKCELKPRPLAWFYYLLLQNNVCECIVFNTLSIQRLN